MASLGSRMKTRQMPWHANMTELNHLGKMLMTKPHVFEGKMNQLFSAKNYYSDNPLSAMAMAMGKEETITQLEWHWQLKGANTRPLVVIENVEPASNTMPGQFGREFKIKLDENWFVATDVITPGTSNKKYQCRIMEDPQRHGNGWIYKVKLVSNNNMAFVPLTYLKAGQQWAKFFSTAAEADHQSGSTQYSAPLDFSDYMGKFRKKYKITDYANQEVLAVKMADNNGKMHSMWMNYAEVEFWQQWYREMELGMWYNRMSHQIVAPNGRSVRTFSGIQEKLEDSHIHYYTELTAKLIEDFLMDIFYSRIKPGVSRKIKVFTGEYGMILFNRAMNDLVETRGFALGNESYTPIEKMQSEYHTNAYSVGAQFLEYKMHNGATLTLIHNPLYDDRSINFEIDPITGYPVESMRFTFLDFSGEGKDSNIKMMTKKDSMSFAYIEGLVGPYGPKKGGMAAHSGSYYEMHAEKTCGIHIEDITRCGELILRRAA